MAALTVHKGFMDTRAARKAPSDPDTDWPARSASSEQKRSFRAALVTAMQAKGLTHTQLAVELYGHYVDKKTKREIVRNASQVYAWLRGETFPSYDAAAGIANYFEKPLSWFIGFDGPLPHIEIKRGGDFRTEAGKARKFPRANGNGHAPEMATPAPHKTAKPEPPPPKPLPEGSKPLSISFKSLDVDPDFADITITGTGSLDMCLGLIAFIERHRPPR